MAATPIIQFCINMNKTMVVNVPAATAGTVKASAMKKPSVDVSAVTMETTCPLEVVRNSATGKRNRR